MKSGKSERESIMPEIYPQRGDVTFLRGNSFIFVLCFREIDLGPPHGIESSKFFLTSLLSRTPKRAICRHQIILVSPRFSTFVSFVHLMLFSASQPGAVC